MALFHTILFTVTLSVGNWDLSVPMYKTLLDFVERDETNDDAGWDLVPSYGYGGELYLTWLVATFFLLSAAFHLGNITLWREFYLSELAECRSPTRYLEYSLSAPVMMIVISYSLGIRNRATLVAIAVLVGVTMPFGYWTEVIARPAPGKRDAWTLPLLHRLYPWFLGHVPQVTAWFLIAWQFYDSVADPDDRIPDFVYAILWGELVLFFSFGGAALLAQWSTPQYFYRGELAFQVLSLVSKGLLGLLMITNVLMLSRFEEVYE